MTFVGSLLSICPLVRADWSQVLALAILGVFCIGYGKLAWRNRLAKKQEVLEEEKRERIAELRKSGQYIEALRSQEVPFGIRAIQSGIRVDGIWCSNPSTPVPGSPKLGHLRSSSDFGPSINNSQSLMNNSQLAGSLSSTRVQLSRSNGSSGMSNERWYGTEDEPQSHQGVNLHKPLRPSHLRYGSHGEANCDGETLDQLEGKLLPISRFNRHPEKQADISSGTTADNERSSGSDTDGTFSNNKKVQTDVERKSLSQWSAQPSDLPASMKIPKLSLPAISFHGSDYFSIPIDSPEDEKSDAFGSVEVSPAEIPLSFKAPNAQTGHSLTLSTISGSTEATVPLLSHTPLPSPFVPGVHLNKRARKVNSGFEVLPAGTLGVPTEVVGNAVSTSGRISSEDGKGQPSVFQKIRTSMTGRRSSTMERP